MILIFSIRDDVTTGDVIQWLQYFKVPFIRINEEEYIEKVKFTVSNSELSLSASIGGKNIELSQITGYWIRRSFINYGFSDKLSKTLDSNIKEVYHYLTKEFEHLRLGLHAVLESNGSRKPISTFENLDINKIDQLRLAAKLDIDIPDSMIASDMQDIADFSKTSKAGIIVKGIGNNFLFRYKGAYYLHYTAALAQQALDQIDMPSTFPCMVQQLIEKKYEIRSFYLRERFYSMAIFSQQNEKTALDFRRYDNKDFNRCVPIRLPSELEEKLQQLMDKLSLECGSLDLIYTKENRFCFLEVNPVGQFGMVSKPCNYHLEKLIAEDLTNTTIHE